MEVSRAVKLARHARATPINPFFSSRPRWSVAICRIRQPLGASTTSHPRRCIATTGRADQQAAARRDEPDDAQDEAQDESSQQSNQTPPQSSQPQPHPRTNPSAASNTPSNSARKSLGKISLQDLLDSLPKTDSAALPRKPSQHDGRRTPVDISQMKDPFLPQRPESYTRESIEGLIPAALRKPVEPDLSPSPVALGPRAGKAVTVDKARNMDVSRAFKVLEMKCGANRLKTQVAQQRFHERPGKKRKRLKKERWRANFRLAMQSTVRRVEEMRRQGW